MGSLTEARPVYDLVLRLASAAGLSHAVKNLVNFTKQTRNNRIVSKTGKRDKDHDFLLRQCIMSLLRPALHDTPDDLSLHVPDLSNVDFGEALPHYVFDQHCMRAMKGNSAYFASCSSVTVATIGANGEYQRKAYLAYIISKGVEPRVADALVEYAAGCLEQPPHVPHPVLASPPLKRPLAPCAGTYKRRKVSPLQLGDYELVSDDQGRYCYGMRNGRKAPVLRGRRSSSPDVMIKFFKTQSAAEYAVWAYDVLASLGLPAPPYRQVVNVEVTPECLAAVADCEEQVATWAKFYVGSTVPCMVATAIGERRDDFRRLCDDDLSDPAFVEELVKVLIVRHSVIISSDCATSNLRVYRGHLYSIDHNVSADPEFVGRKFSRRLREAVLAEARSGKYDAFMADCRKRYPCDWVPLADCLS